jgi:hypothetical protein
MPIIRRVSEPVRRRRILAEAGSAGRFSAAVAGAGWSFN